MKVGTTGPAAEVTATGTGCPVPTSSAPSP